jgi:hypothetical protein
MTSAWRLSSTCGSTCGGSSPRAGLRADNSGQLGPRLWIATTSKRETVSLISVTPRQSRFALFEAGLPVFGQAPPQARMFQVPIRRLRSRSFGRRPLIQGGPQPFEVGEDLSGRRLFGHERRHATPAG